MVNRCVAAGCSNTHKDGISLFKFPKNPHLLKKWVEQVRRTRDKWEPTKHSVLCSMHFEADCFEPYSVLSQSMGLSKKTPKLKPDAVPTIFRRPKRPATGDPEGVDPVPKKARSAYEKRERARVGKLKLYL